jgi:hypothetical protein
MQWIDTIHQILKYALALTKAQQVRSVISSTHRPVWLTPPETAVRLAAPCPEARVQSPDESFHWVTLRWRDTEFRRRPQ